MFIIQCKDRLAESWEVRAEEFTSFNPAQKRACVLAAYGSMTRVIDGSGQVMVEFDGTRGPTPTNKEVRSFLASGQTAHPLINRLVDLHETDDPYRGTVTYVDATGLMLAVPNYEERTYSTFFPWSRVQRVTVVDQ